MSVTGADAPCGYCSRDYAEALGMASRLLLMPACGGQLLVRKVGSTGLEDACGAYPVFSCREPDGLADDIESIGDGLLSLTLIADPLLGWTRGQLERSFELVRPLGAHHVVDLDRLPLPLDRHHRRALRKAAAFDTEIRIEAEPAAFALAWTALYEVLVAKAGITGLRRFSAAIFDRMLAVPGTVVFSAWDGDTLLGADWYFQDGPRVYAHLSAYSAAGYARAVSYPMMDAALRHFAAQGASVLDLGGVPLLAGPGSGLARFKQGWSTRMLTALLCGRVLDRAAYVGLGGSTDPAADGYFPAYRRGEYG